MSCFLILSVENGFRWWIGEIQATAAHNQLASLIPFLNLFIFLHKKVLETAQEEEERSSQVGKETYILPAEHYINK